MEYIKVFWNHDRPDEPIELYSELDDRRMEIRKVEIFPDGTFGFAGPDDAIESTRLALEPLPGLDEIANDPQFEPWAITRADFERVWNAARRIDSFR